MAENELRRHKIRAELYDNLLTEDPNDFAARVVADKPLTSKDVCNYATQRGGADISSKAMEHAVDLYLGEMVYLLCNGFTVNKPSELIVVIPNLGTGTYKLEIATQFSGANSKQVLKEPRKMVFDRILTVV